MITSVTNQQIKNVISLIKKPKVRKDQGLFVVEGVKMFQEAPEERIHKVYLTQRGMDLLDEESRARADRVDHEMVDEKVFKTVSDTVSPQGVLCVVRQRKYSIEEILNFNDAEKLPLIMMLENLQDPGNLGSILRTGEGAGATGMILSKDSVDIYNPKTIRSTMGSIYRVPFVYVEDLEAVLPFLKELSISTYAAHLNGRNPYDREDYTKGTVFFVGNEGNGLSGKLSKAADRLIRIPMAGQLESLNAGIAAAVLLYEANRQRRI